MNINAEETYEDNEESGTVGAFNAEQTKALNDRLDKRLLKTKQGKLFIETYVAINHLNRVFGYGMWSRQVISQGSESDEKGNILYFAVVRLSVTGATGIVSIHEDEGSSIAPVGKDSGKVALESRDTARKGAVSDALKRCARAYGNQYGNCLYDKDFLANDAKLEAQERAQAKTTGDIKAEHERLLMLMVELEKEKVAPGERAAARKSCFTVSELGLPTNVARPETWTTEQIVTYGKFLRGMVKAS